MQRYGASRRQRRAQFGGTNGLHCHHSDFRPEGGDNDAGTCKKAATAHRYHKRPDIGILLQDFQGTGGLSGNDIGVIERRNDDQPLLGRNRLGALLPGLRSGSTEDDLSTESPDALYLDVGGVVRHDDRRTATEVAGGEGHSLAMISAGVCNNARRPLGGGQQGDGVVGAADLEGPHRLLLLTLEVSRYPEPLGEGRELHQRRANRDSVESTGGAAHILQ